MLTVALFGSVVRMYRRLCTEALMDLMWQNLTREVQAGPGPRTYTQLECPFPRRALALAVTTKLGGTDMTAFTFFGCPIFGCTSILTSVVDILQIFAVC